MFVSASYTQRLLHAHGIRLAGTFGATFIGETKFKLNPGTRRSISTTIVSAMADDNSLAKTRGKRVKKEVAIKDTTLKAVESAQSQSPAPAPETLKRKHVYDSLEHCRATRSRSTNNKAETKKETANSSDPADDEELGTIGFIESLRSKSSSRSGRFHDTSLDGRSYNLKITTWNINGLRGWLAKRSGLSFIAQDDADIYCFQETKCANSKVPNEVKEVPGYSCFWNGTEDGHSGVVCFSKKQPQNVTYGIGTEVYDKEARVITLEFDKYYVINAYVPNSGRGLVRLSFRMKWDSDFQNYLKELDSRKPVILCGDLNVSHHEIDLANPKTNLKTAGFTIGERDNFTKLLESVDLVDVYRFLNPDKKDCYTFWTYMKNAREKNIGWRLDYFLLSKRWSKKICDCIIRNDVHGSDHCPVSLYMAL